MPVKAPPQTSHFRYLYNNVPTKTDTWPAGVDFLVISRQRQPVPGRREVLEFEIISGMERPNCLKCKHYHSTYDANRPRGCKIYGFKSTTMPSVLVKNESGKECQAFQLQKHFEKKEDKFDFNRKDYW